MDGAKSSLEKCAAASFPVLSTIFEIHSRVGITLPDPRERRQLNSFGNDYSKPAYKHLSHQYQHLGLSSQKGTFLSLSCHNRGCVRKNCWNKLEGQYARYWPSKTTLESTHYVWSRRVINLSLPHWPRSQNLMLRHALTNFTASAVSTKVMQASSKALAMPAFSIKGIAALEYPMNLK